MPDDQIAPQVSPQVQPSADLPMAVTANALGAGVGEAVESMAEVATKVHRDAVSRANQTAVLDADNQKNAFLQSRLYDAKTGILSQNLGKDAPGAVDQTLADFDAHVAKVQDGLANDEQKVQFQRMAQATRFDMERQLSHYEHAETTRYADEVDQAAVASTTTAAVHSAGDAEQVGVELEKQKAIIADAGARKGLPPEAIAEQQAQAASATHMAVLEQLSSTGRDVDAKAWYDAHKDGLVGKDPTIAAKLVEASSLAGQSQRIADTITVDKDGNVLSRAEIDEKIRTDPRLQTNEKLRDEVQARADRRLLQHHEEVTEQERADFKEAFATAKDAPGGITDPRVVTLMTKLSPESQQQLKAAFAKDGVIRTNQLEMNTLLVQSARDPDGFLKSMRDPALPARFATSDLTALLAREKEIRTTGGVADAPGILTREQEIDRGIAAAGLGQLKPTDPKRVAFVDALNARIVAYEQASGKKAQPSDIGKAADEIAIATAVQPAGSIWGYGKETPVYQLSPEQRDSASRDLAAYAKTNPAAASQLRATFTDGARRLGMDTSRLTDEQLNRAFAQHLIARDLAAAGDRVAAQHAVDRLNAILSERGTAAKPTGTTDREALDQMRAAGWIR